MSPLIDSDVLVWLTRGHVGAAQRLHALRDWRISVVTYTERAHGCGDKAELARLKKGLAARRPEIVPITPAVSDRAAELIDSPALSHGKGRPGAATARANRGTRLTPSACAMAGSEMSVVMYSTLRASIQAKFKGSDTVGVGLELPREAQPPTRRAARTLVGTSSRCIARF